MQEVTGQEIQLHPRVMLLFNYDKDCRYKELVENMLMANLKNYTNSTKMENQDSTYLKRMVV